MPPRIGVLGGTFDPPHEGHLSMARLALEKLGLDEVIFVPVLRPSHKSDAMASFEDRLQMVRLLVGGECRMSVSDVESSLGEKSYTAPMLEALGRTLGPETELYFLIGADSLEQIHQWYRYADILRLARIVAFSRPGFKLENPNLTVLDRARIQLVDGLASPASSRIFRDRLEGDVPQRVSDYVSAKGLYAKRQ